MFVGRYSYLLTRCDALLTLGPAGTIRRIGIEAAAYCECGNHPVGALHGENGAALRGGPF